MHLIYIAKVLQQKMKSLQLARMFGRNHGAKRHMPITGMEKKIQELLQEEMKIDLKKNKFLQNISQVDMLGGAAVHTKLKKITKELKVPPADQEEKESPVEATKQIVNQVEKAEKIYEESREKLFGDPAPKRCVPKSSFERPLDRYIPEGISKTLLVYPNTSNSTLLIGVDPRSSVHALFIYDLVSQLCPESLLLGFPSDFPLFPRINGEYRSTWEQFLSVRSFTDYYINPYPKDLYELGLYPNQIRELLSGVFSL